MNAMDKIFEWKPMPEEKKVKFACTKLKVHAMIWWDHVHKDRVRKGKDKIKTWRRMEKKLPEFFLPLDYAQTLFRRFQNLKQNLFTVEELTNEFYQLSICMDHLETDEQLAKRNVNGS